ncbi:MAG: YczE/YyaS/YitT family protein [Candidatus Fimivivens sp.]
MIFGIALYSCGIYMTIQANLGLSSWDALHMGINYTTGISFGNASVLVGLFILVADVLLGEKIGFGTIINTIMIGKFVDLLDYIELLPKMESLFLGLLLLIAGLVIICFGMYFYMNAALGGGPRDSLMVAFHRKLPTVPIGLMRALLEGAALLSGWLLGGPVGIGTLVAVLSIGFIMQGVFTLVHFDPKAVQHESLMVTVKRIRTAQKI